jgi:hypothetical protein
MKKNVGGIDRGLRIIIGLVIGVLGVVFKTWWGLLGIIPLLTGFIRFCPLYEPLKISSSKSKHE